MMVVKPDWFLKFLRMVIKHCDWFIKHCPIALWFPARCIKYPYALFIAYPKVFTEFAQFVLQAKD